MLELFINKQENLKRIALVENGKLIELYEQTEDEIRNEGNIYIGIVKDIVKGMASAFVDIGTEKNSFIHLSDLLPKIDETKQNKDNNINIEQIVKTGDKILVQVKKDSNAKKGARISKHINLPSKFIALMPNTDIITISQKIENKEEQKRLINLVKNNLSKGNGAIIRTSAEGKEEEIVEDIKRIEKKWNEINEAAKQYKGNEPKLIYKCEDIVEKMLIDMANKKIEKIVVNDKIEYAKIKELKQQNKEFKDLSIAIKSEDIFETYELEKQIEKSKRRKIWLNCGGFITIDATEALTAIDVNTGKFTGKSDLEKTVYKVNEEATVEIAKQLRLRDIGGIIIIDYIDMKSKENKQKIENKLKECLKNDRSKTQVEGFTKLDLMEMTRKHICSHKE
jgi:ribonuclease G